MLSNGHNEMSAVTYDSVLMGLTGLRGLRMIRALVVELPLRSCFQVSSADAAWAASITCRNRRLRSSVVLSNQSVLQMRWMRQPMLSR